MLATSYAPAIIGIDSHLISIECDTANGLPGLIVVGLGDKAVNEARERVRSAIKNSGLKLPPLRITLNLAPADLPKDGSGYDLGMAVAVLAASRQLDRSRLSKSLFLGELALNGELRPIKGALLAAEMASRFGFERLYVSPQNASEAAFCAKVQIIAVDNLADLTSHLNGRLDLHPHQSIITPTRPVEAAPSIDLDMIYGQSLAKRAIEIAAAGGHNILLSGPPGTGKTMLAKSIPGIMPAPSPAEAYEIAKIHSLAGRRVTSQSQVRPFRAPHHSASEIAMIGGGSKPRPGEISLSHGGILFLDELPEFPRSVIEILRQPLEDGTITLSRAAGVATFPARFMLVATCNPCPCGYAGDQTGNCHCLPASVERYRRKFSGPLIDRIDIAIDVNRVDQDKVVTRASDEPSRVVAQRVGAARSVQQSRRYKNGYTNAHMSSTEIQKYCRINNDTLSVARIAMSQLELSNRAYNRTLKVARTIADLSGSADIMPEHFTEAVQYRPRLEAFSLKAVKPAKP